MKAWVNRKKVNFFFALARMLAKIRAFAKRVKKFFFEKPVDMGIK